jgi:hypothetical protein
MTSRRSSELRLPEYRRLAAHANRESEWFEQIGIGPGCASEGGRDAPKDARKNEAWFVGPLDRSYPFGWSNFQASLQRYAAVIGRQAAVKFCDLESAACDEPARSIDRPARDGRLRLMRGVAILSAARKTFTNSFDQEKDDVHSP